MKLKIVNQSTKVGDVDIVVIDNQKGLRVRLTSYGAAIHRIQMKNGNGHHDDVVVAPIDVNDFLVSDFYYGKLVGRTSGRLHAPSYQIADKQYPVTPFGGKTSKLHGGEKGFSFQHFTIEEQVVESDHASVTFRYFSQHLEEGYPGNLEVLATYTLDVHDRLTLDIKAKSDRDTLCNITNHAYFNMGLPKNKIYDHELMIKASRFLDIKPDFTLKAVRPVEGTPWDFRTPVRLGTAMEKMLDTPFGGFDHNWLFDDHGPDTPVIDLYEPETDRGLQMFTTYPSVVVYTHNRLSSAYLRQVPGESHHASLAIECQYEPGGIHHPELSSAILPEGKPYHHQIIYQFYRRKHHEA